MESKEWRQRYLVKKRQYKRKEKQMNQQSIDELQLLVLEESLNEFEITHDEYDREVPKNNINFYWLLEI